MNTQEITFARQEVDYTVTPPDLPELPTKLISLTLPNGHTLSVQRNVKAIWLLDRETIVVVNRGGGRELIHPSGCRCEYVRGKGVAGR